VLSEKNEMNHQAALRVGETFQVADQRSLSVKASAQQQLID
jgi:hypothetical protein